MPKHAKVKLYEKYGSDGTLKGERCPRCGGLLANHKNRLTCGKCGYSTIAKTPVKPIEKESLEEKTTVEKVENEETEKPKEN